MSWEKNSKNHVYARAGLVVDDYSQLLPMVLYGVSHLSRPILLHSCDAGLNQVKKRPFPSLACIQHTHKLTQTHSIRAPTSWDGNRSREKTHPKSCGRHGSTRISLSKHINICIFISIYCKLQIYVIYEYVNMMFAYFCNFWVVQPVDHVFFFPPQRTGPGRPVAASPRKIPLSWQLGFSTKLVNSNSYW